MCFPLETQLEVSNTLNRPADHSICSVLCPLLVLDLSMWHRWEPNLQLQIIMIRVSLHGRNDHCVTIFSTCSNRLIQSNKLTFRKGQTSAQFSCFYMIIATTIQAARTSIMFHKTSMSKKCYVVLTNNRICLIAGQRECKSRNIYTYKIVPHVSFKNPRMLPTEMVGSNSCGGGGRRRGSPPPHTHTNT